MSSHAPILPQGAEKQLIKVNVVAVGLVGVEGKCQYSSWSAVSWSFQELVNFSLSDLSKITLVTPSFYYAQLASLYSSDYWGILRAIMLETKFFIYEDKTIGNYWRSRAP